MSGRGTRFSAAGYVLPKPLIDVHGRAMIDLVVSNLKTTREHQFIFLCLREHLVRYDLEQHLGQIAPGCVVIPVEGTTEGAACTVLLARDVIDTADPLVIANSDQWFEAPMDRFVGTLLGGNVDGLIMTMTATDPKWSFVRIDPAGWVIEVAEKRAISADATVGVYGFTSGHRFVRAADRMIAKDLRVNGEFYVAPVYNECLAMGDRVGIFNVGRAGVDMYGLGTPEDLDVFLAAPISRR